MTFPKSGKVVWPGLHTLGSSRNRLNRFCGQPHGALEPLSLGKTVRESSALRTLDMIRAFQTPFILDRPLKR